MPPLSNVIGSDPMPDPFRVGDWRVDPSLDQISRGDTVLKLEPRSMRLLVLLAQRPSQLFTTEEILAAVWKDTIVTSSSIYESVAQLRKALGDHADQPHYIATVARKGYRLVAPVSPWPPSDAKPALSNGAGSRALAPKPGAAGIAGWTVALSHLPSWAPAALILLTGVGLLLHNLAPTNGIDTASSEATAEPIQTSTKPATRTPQVLWVDDKPSNNVREREALAALGVTFSLAESTEAAVRQLNGSTYDLIISDMNRPGEEAAGYRLLKILRDRGDPTRFVLYTSSCTDAQMHEARSRGALGCATQVSQLMQLSIAALEARR